jgi:thiamine-phosphate pyrophosphorylase
MGAIDFSFYLVTDRFQIHGRSLIDVCEAALRAGVRAVQLREKDLHTRPLLAMARELLQMAEKYGAKILVNDRLDVALAARAHGAHLPAAGFPVSVGRRVLSPQRLLGVSAHSADEVVSAAANGADFVVLGPIYDTPSKRSFGPPIGVAELNRARTRCTIPIFAIGGITPERVREVRCAGADGVAVIGSVMAADDVERACRAFLKALQS